MDIHRAAAQIDAIWSHLARVERFQGYRPATVGLMGVIGLAAAAMQSALVPQPLHDLDPYLGLWIGVAVACVVIVGLGLGWDYLRRNSPIERQLTRQAVQQFVPCLVAGGVLTWLIVDCHPEASILLPGLWAVCFSLGIFASLPYLSPHVLWVAGYYLLAGMAALYYGRGEFALSPWLMAGSFGGGQLLMAVVLHLSRGRSNGEA